MAAGFQLSESGMLERIPYRQGEWDPVLKVRHREEVDMDELMDMGRRLDRLTDRIAQSGWRPEVSEQSLEGWVREMVPMYMAEGAAEKVIYPETVEFVDFDEADLHTRVLARHYCVERRIVVNGRMRNEWSSWFESQRYTATIAHELAHLQQKENSCKLLDVRLIETTAEIVAMEVLAALANDGNREAGFALIHEMAVMVLGAGLYQSIVEGRREEYDEFRESLGGELERAVYERYVRTREDDFLEFMLMLEGYRLGPYLAITEAIREDEERIYGLALDLNEVWVYDYTRGLTERRVRYFKIDDLAQFLARMEAKVGEWLA